ncbi:MAG TPA: hypothetical protein VMF13_19735 [Luteitalea sp.]|nr:hypothetical protein [Luteitalea sp.]
MPPFEVRLDCAAFVEDLRRFAKRDASLKPAVIKKLDHVARNPVELGRRLQMHPHCFKVRVGSDFRLVYLLRDFDVVPLMLYAKNEHSDVVLRDLLHAIELVTRRAKG